MRRFNVLTSHTVTLFEGEAKGLGGECSTDRLVEFDRPSSGFPPSIDFHVLTRVKFTWVSKIGQCMEVRA